MFAGQKSKASRVLLQYSLGSVAPPIRKYEFLKNISFFVMFNTHVKAADGEKQNCSTSAQNSVRWLKVSPSEMKFSARFLEAYLLGIFDQDRIDY